MNRFWQFIKLLALYSIALTSMAWAEVSDSTYLALIARDPKAETPRYEYAVHLFTAKRFADSRQQLGFLFALNPEHYGGKNLLKNITDLEGLNDTAYQDIQIKKFLAAKSQIEKQLAPVLVDGKAKSIMESELPADRYQQLKKDMDTKFSLSQRVKTEIGLQGEELRLQEQFDSFRLAGQNDKAEKVAREWIAKYDKSAIANADFAAFLIYRDRIPQAEALIKFALESNQGSLKLLVVNEAIKDIKGAKSSEQTSAVKARLKDELVIYKNEILSFTSKTEERQTAQERAPLDTPLNN